MNIVLDASAVIAVITNEATKEKIIGATMDAELIAPESIHWEIGNAFSALLKKRILSLEQGLSALKIYTNIPIRFVSVDLEKSLVIAKECDIYAYDAYLIECALKYESPLLTLDMRLIEKALQRGVEVVQL
jgi:predicted nucleic acid-binding protein